MMLYWITEMTTSCLLEEHVTQSDSYIYTGVGDTSYIESEQNGIT